MALLDKHLIVKRSTIPGAGKGLFTKIMIPKGTRIVEYKGKVTRWKEVDHQDGMNAYIYYVNRNCVIDASRNKNLARYVNDARGAKKIENLTNNCIYVQDKDCRVFVESKKDIPANAEILVAYGKEYWDIITKNRKESEQEKKPVKKTRTKPVKKAP